MHKCCKTSDSTYLAHGSKPLVINNFDVSFQKSTVCLICWMFAVAILTFPEAGMVIYMSVQYWVSFDIHFTRRNVISFPRLTGVKRMCIVFVKHCEMLGEN